jgi:F0F1-type ATP synthase assembly protein I
MTRNQKPIDVRKVASPAEVLTVELCIVAGVMVALYVIDPDAALAALVGYAAVWLLRTVRAIVRRARRGGAR